MTILREFRISNPVLKTEVYELVSNYVTYGEWKTPDQFDHIFFRLIGLIPRPTHGMSLFRVIRLTEEQTSHYHAGSLVLSNRQFSSWTRSIDVAQTLAQTKGDNCLIVSEFFSPDHIVLDIADFYEDNDLNNYRISEWDKYVRRELEIGDGVFFHSEDDRGDTIDEIEHNQDFANRGIYSVILKNGMTYLIRSIGSHQWEIVEEVNEDYFDPDPTETYHNAARAHDFAKLADDQRGEPENAMLRVQHANLGGVLSYVVEHVGDLTNRMAQHPDRTGFYCGFELVEPKVRRSLDMLTSGYGFEKEAKQNNISNAQYRGQTVKEFETRLNSALTIYAAAHKKLAVYNAAQWLAREAAIALGERNWKRVIACLRGLYSNMSDRESWAALASPYDPDFDKDTKIIV